MPPLQTIAVNCNHCGATLQVDEKTRFVTCNYCHSRLAIQRSDSTVFTEVLEKIQEQTGHMAENLELIKLQNELEQIDREWMMSREENLVVNSKNGSRSEPSAVGGIILILFGLAAGGAWIYFTSSVMHDPFGRPTFPAPVSFIIPMFGFVFICATIFGGINMINKAGRLDEARRTHEMRRRSLIGRIETEKRRHARAPR